MSLTAVCVDDHPMELAQITRILSQHGIAIAGTERDGQSGLDMIRRERPSIAVLDFMLPLVSGVEIVQAVRDEQIPTILFMASGSGQDSLKRRCLALGAKTFFVKPYDDIKTWNALALVLKAENLL